MNPLPLIAISRRYDPELLRELAATADIVMPPDEVGALSREALLGVAGRLAALITQGETTVDSALLAAAPHLRIVANAAIGVNNLDLEGLLRRGIWATNAPEGFVEATADCALGLLLMLARRLGEADRFVRAGHWTAFEPGRWDGRLLRGKVLGLIGYGRIGRAVERRAAAFGLTVIHHTRTRSGAPQWRTLDALLTEADVVSLHVPLNVDSERLLDAPRLALMKPGAWLISLARGQVVDEPALVAALQSGRLGGAALDVFAGEPCVPEALRAMENVVLTPHLGGGTREGRRSAQEQCLDNVARVLRGERPRTECIVVEPSALAATTSL